MNRRKLIKTIGKKIYASPFLHNIVAIILFLLIKFVEKTSRLTFDGLENIEPFWQQKKPVIVALWHGRIMLIPSAWSKDTTKINALVSRHRDGAFFAKVLNYFGVGVVSGSSNNGAISSALELNHTLKNGESIVITPDGPKGPRMKMGRSLVFFASTSGVPIIPVTFSVKKAKIFNTWDRFMFALPFNKGVYIIGEPIVVPKDANEETLENFRIELEKKLISIQNQADIKMGREPINPD